MSRDDAYAKWLAADQAWSAELQRVFGKHAGDARYRPAGVSSTALRRLHDRVRRAEAAYRRASSPAGA